MINLNAGINSIQPTPNFDSIGTIKPNNAETKKPDFANVVDAVEKQVSKVNDLQESSNTAIKDLMAGKNEDINSVVAAVAKADMSFKLLVGVRNKLIEAYKQTMNMPL